jgi:hypothetical protein
LSHRPVIFRLNARAKALPQQAPHDPRNERKR